MTNTNIILDIAKSKKQLVFDNIICKNTTVIIDFYNCYCTLIKFCKFKTFSLETYQICMERIITAIAGRKTIIIAKNIFEVDLEIIRELTKRYKNITYIVVEDTCETKSINRERDDYVCLLYHLLLPEKSLVISNDKYSNFYKLINSVKPFRITTIYNNETSSVEINEASIKEYNKSLVHDHVNRTGFKFNSLDKFEIFRKKIK